jgi:predicted DNA-binding protein with PD1-like motif
MKSKLLQDENGLKTFALVFDKGEEVKEPLLRFANENELRLRGAQVTAIGAFSEVTLGFFDRPKKRYREIPVNEQVEVLSFAGNIVEKDGKQMLPRSRFARLSGETRPHLTRHRYEVCESGEIAAL